MGRGGLMRLWRLSTAQFADRFDGGYGRLHEGRWNTAGHAVTYCATSPSLCVLEKLAHIEAPELLPDLVMIVYEIPDHATSEALTVSNLPADWLRQRSWTQDRGDRWHRARSSLLLRIPSALLPIEDSPDVNVVINHEHSGVGEITVHGRQPYAFDPRLL
jgi:RES domain-containing protein